MLASTTVNLPFQATPLTTFNAHFRILLAPLNTNPENPKRGHAIPHPQSQFLAVSNLKPHNSATHQSATPQASPHPTSYTPTSSYCQNATSSNTRPSRSSICADVYARKSASKPRAGSDLHRLGRVRSLPASGARYPRVPRWFVLVEIPCSGSTSISLRRGCSGFCI